MLKIIGIFGVVSLLWPCTKNI